ncbi:MAG TPA: hypothetical protein VLB09_05605 [Nitrospiria bacterium]|nr:hypothetical protein [Nitrospiria bacterium]
MVRLLSFFLVLLFPLHSALASPLEDRAFEFNFDFYYGDTDDFGTFTALDGAILFIAGTGYVEAGLVLSYFSEDDDFSGIEFDGHAIGPRIDLNLTPAYEATPYLTASLGVVGGDYGDFYEHRIVLGGGLKAFINEWAAFTVMVGRETFTGDTNFDDLKTTFINAGFSLFGGSK